MLLFGLRHCVYELRAGRLLGPLTPGAGLSALATRWDRLRSSCSRSLLRHRCRCSLPLADRGGLSDLMPAGVHANRGPDGHLNTTLACRWLHGRPGLSGFRAGVRRLPGR